MNMVKSQQATENKLSSRMSGIKIRTFTDHPLKHPKRDEDCGFQVTPPVGVRLRNSSDHTGPYPFLTGTGWTHFLLSPS